jgi:hypothetical protein
MEVRGQHNAQPLDPRAKPRHTLKGGWMGPRAIPDILENRKISFLLPEFEPESVQSVV